MIQLRGVSYLVDAAEPEQVRRHLRAIAGDLHCNAVTLISRDPGQLLDAAEAALAAGLEVHLRPDGTDLPQADMLANLATIAQAAEGLRRDHPGRVTLLVGAELSHTAPGIVPGPRSFIRLHLILRFGRLLRRRVTTRLHDLLARAAAVAREHFDGPLTYAAGTWEHVDWSLFDLVGVSLYRTGPDRDGYAERLRALVAGADKPVIVTEFGCGAFTGADLLGPGSFTIVNWFAEPPRIPREHPRDEQVQAHYLTELIDLFEAEGVTGCFVFTYAMADFPRSDEPQYDLDRAGFGLLSVRADGTVARKAAFAAVAERFGR